MNNRPMKRAIETRVAKMLKGALTKFAGVCFSERGHDFKIELRYYPEDKDGWPQPKPKPSFWVVWLFKNVPGGTDQIVEWDAYDEFELMVNVRACCQLALEWSEQCKTTRETRLTQEPPFKRSLRRQAAGRSGALPRSASARDGR